MVGQRVDVDPVSTLSPDYISVLVVIAAVHDSALDCRHVTLPGSTDCYVAEVNVGYMTSANRFLRSEKNAVEVILRT